MITSAEKNPIPKITALILVSIGVALVMQRTDISILAKINSTSPEDYYDHARHLYQHSFLHQFLIAILFGGFFLGTVEFVAYLISFLFKNAAKPPHA